MTDELDLYVEPDGSIRFIHDDELAESLADVGVSRITGASRVEPVSEPCPDCYSATGHRDGCAYDGPELPATGWVADLRPVSGPVLGPYRRRDAALRAELDWLGVALAEGRLSA